MKDYLDHLINPTQRSPEWFDQRIGKFTSSEWHRLMTPVYVEREMTKAELEARPKKGVGSRTTKVSYEEVDALSPGAITYVREKVAEHLTGCQSDFSSAATVWGEEHEEEARRYFESISGMSVEACGFTPFQNIAGGSPDGFIKLFNHIIEIKCPMSSTKQVEYLLWDESDVRESYPEAWWQCQMNLLFTGASLCYLCTYDPRMPGPYKMKVFKISPDLEDQNKGLRKLHRAQHLKDQIIQSIQLNNS